MVDLRKNMHNEIMEELYKDKRFFQNYVPYLSDVEKWGCIKRQLWNLPTAAMPQNVTVNFGQKLKKAYWNKLIFAAKFLKNFI